MFSKKFIGIFIVVLSYVAFTWYHAQKSLPVDLSLESPVQYVDPGTVSFLVDETYIDEGGQRVSEQEIFNEVFSMIRQAKENLVIDMFLFNEWQGSTVETTRLLAGELTQKLIDKKEKDPDVVIVVISDPINTVYGGVLSIHYEQLRQEGIEVVVTDLHGLRDSNPIYSGWWRLLFGWRERQPATGSMSHPFDAREEKVSVHSWLELLNFKANHRKVVLADESVLVTSANPHDGSSAHSNVAIKVERGLGQVVWQSEQAVACLSGACLPEMTFSQMDKGNNEGEVGVQLLTESAIRHKLISLIDQTDRGDNIAMAMFYLADRPVIRSLKAAGDRGVKIRLILDPNRDAFGRIKNGVPNRPVAHELVSDSEEVTVRWCDTHGEQCHSKLVLIDYGDRQAMMLGSANLTRRNIGDYNLESNVLITTRRAIPATAKAGAYFERAWGNLGGKTYTADYESYAEGSTWKRLLYLCQEETGLSSF